MSNDEHCSIFGCTNPASSRELIEADGTGRKVWLNLCGKHSELPQRPGYRERLENGDCEE